MSLRPLLVADRVHRAPSFGANISSASLRRSRFSVALVIGQPSPTSSVLRRVAEQLEVLGMRQVPRIGFTLKPLRDLFDPRSESGSVIPPPRSAPNEPYAKPRPTECMRLTYAAKPGLLRRTSEQDGGDAPQT